jgi:hypothetical protein
MKAAEQGLIGSPTVKNVGSGRGEFGGEERMV